MMTHMGYQQLPVQLLPSSPPGDALPASMIIIITTAVVVGATMIAQLYTHHVAGML